MEKLLFFEEFNSFPSRHVKKGAYILRPGDFGNNFFYVKKGCLRSYIIDQKGKEHIYQFAPEEWIICDEEAMVENKEAMLYIEAIEDSEIKVLPHPTSSRWPINLNKETATEVINRLQRKVYSLRKRIIQLLSASAEERYSSFISTYPDLAQRVPQKMIASYLGITPESLSRVRKEIADKK